MTFPRLSEYPACPACGSTMWLGWCECLRCGTTWNPDQPTLLDDQDTR